MPNNFSREERVAFDDVLEAFDGALVASRAATKVSTNQTEMARTGDVIWFPQPYIMPSYAGNNATANFLDVTQLSVPAQINQQQHVPWVMSATDLRDAQQSGRLATAASTRLSFDMDVSCGNVAAQYGSVFIKRNGVATGFDDVAACDAAFTTQGIPRAGRKMLIGPTDWNNMASTIAKPQTSANSNVNTAYERALLPNVAGFDVYKADYVPALTAATAGTVVITAVSNTAVPTGTGGYVPLATTTSTNGLVLVNVDNRTQNVTITNSGAAVKVGDAFTLPGVIAVNHGAKTSTGTLKTFRIVGIVSGGGGAGVITICPPIIPFTGAGIQVSQLQYANVVSAPALPLTATFLNNAPTSFQNPFWCADALQIMPGKLMPATESGMAVMSGTTDQGFTLLMTRQGEINTLSTRYRFDALWGVNAMQPQMMGVMTFGNT